MADGCVAGFARICSKIDASQSASTEWKGDEVALKVPRTLSNNSGRILRRSVEDLKRIYSDM